MIRITPPPLSSQSMADLFCTITILCRGQDDNGMPFWAYMCVKPSMVASFRAALDGGEVHLEDFGTIIESGYGAYVPSEIAYRMEHDYGINHNYEDELLHVVQQVALEQQ